MKYEWEAEKKTKICPDCKEVMKIDADKCPHCHYVIGTNTIGAILVHIVLLSLFIFNIPLWIKIILGVYFFCLVVTGITKTIEWFKSQDMDDEEFEAFKEYFHNKAKQVDDD